MAPSSITAPIPALDQVAVPLISPVKVGPPDIIPGFLPRQGQLLIAGETEVGKSLVALEICSALTSPNTALWNELSPTLQARKILYVLGEHYNEVIQRLWAITGLPMSNQVWLLGPERLGYDKWLVIKGQVNLIAVEKFKRWTEGADLIVFDPLSAFLTGEGAENDNMLMRMALDTMSLIAQSAGASCLVLAHLGKPMLDQQGKEHRRQSYAIRGASAIEDAATNIFYMERAAATENNLPEGVQVLQLRKRKYKGVAPDKFVLMRDALTKRHTLLGNRPNCEVRRISTQAEVTRFQLAFPHLSISDAVKAVAAIHNINERTAWRHLQPEASVVSFSTLHTDAKEAVELGEELGD